MKLTISRTPTDIAIVVALTSSDLDVSIPLMCAVKRDDHTLLFETDRNAYHQGYGDPFTISPTLRDVLTWLLEDGGAWYRDTGPLDEQLPL